MATYGSLEPNVESGAWNETFQTGTSANEQPRRRWSKALGYTAASVGLLCLGFYSSSHGAYTGTMADTALAGIDVAAGVSTAVAPPGATYTVNKTGSVPGMRFAIAAVPTSSAPGIALTNKYISRYGPSGVGYTWLKEDGSQAAVAEPFKETMFVALLDGVSSIDGDKTCAWTVSRDLQQHKFEISLTDDNVNVTTSTALPTLSHNFTNLGKHGSKPYAWLALIRNHRRDLRSS